MKETKFRGKSIKTDEWLYGYYIVYAGEHFIMIESKGTTFVGSFKSCYKKSIGQFTGLLDKNGKEIYEGDVIQWTAKFRDTDIDTPPKSGRVEYERQACSFWINYEWENPDGKVINSYKELRATYGDGDVYTNDSLEIIGNIYQNPELIISQK